MPSGTITLDGTVQQVFSEAGPIAVVARIDLSELTAGDTVIMRHTVDLLEGGTVDDFYTELVYGTTVVEGGGTLGTDLDGWHTIPLWAEVASTLTIEQTVGAAADVKWEWRAL